jgi:anti-sigma factor RsiW
MSEDEASHLNLETLHGLLDGALSPKETARAEAHLAACSKCSREIASLRAVFDSLASLPEEPLRLDLRPRVMAGIEPVRRRRFRIGWLLGAQLAGAALAAWIARPWLAGMLSLVRGSLLADWITSRWVTLTGHIGGAWEMAASSAADTLGSFLAIRWASPIHVVPISQILCLVAAACALCVVGNGILLGAARAESRRSQGSR